MEVEPIMSVSISQPKSETQQPKAATNKTRIIKKKRKQKRRSCRLQKHGNNQKVKPKVVIDVDQQAAIDSQDLNRERLQNFWGAQIDKYYRKELTPKQLQVLENFIKEPISSLQSIIVRSPPANQPRCVCFEELLKFIEQFLEYMELITQCRTDGQLLLVQNQQRHFLAVLEQQQLARLVEVSQTERAFVGQRLKFIRQCGKEDYNKIQNKHRRLLTQEMGFLRQLMKRSKNGIANTLSQILQKIDQQQVQKAEVLYQQTQDQYISFLIQKNLKRALVSTEIDYLNYYAHLDITQKHGNIEDCQKNRIKSKQQFDRYIRSKTKKNCKSGRNILRTACGGCLSAHSEQYNPFFSCCDCKTRYHKYCYTPTNEGLCQNCLNLRLLGKKSRSIQCQLCGVSGLLLFPHKIGQEKISVHIFCMLINNLWRVQNGTLDFDSQKFVASYTNHDICSICQSRSYTYPCKHCQAKAHPLCAYMNGWSMELAEGRVEQKCSCRGVETSAQSYRRKFVLNYNKMLQKPQKKQ